MRLPLILPLVSSRSLGLAVGSVHLVAAMVPFIVALPLLAKLVIWALLLLSLAIQVRRPKPVALTLRADGQLELLFADGAAVTAGVVATTTVFPWLVVLLTRSAGSTRVLALPVDALGPDGHRQLRLWLKWKAVDGEA